MLVIRFITELSQNKAEVIAKAILSNFVNIPTAVVRQAIKLIILPKLKIDAKKLLIIVRKG